MNAGYAGAAPTLPACAGPVNMADFPISIVVFNERAMRFCPEWRPVKSDWRPVKSDFSSCKGPFVKIHTKQRQGDQAREEKSKESSELTAKEAK